MRLEQATERLAHAIGVRRVRDEDSIRRELHPQNGTLQARVIQVEKRVAALERQLR